MEVSSKRLEQALGNVMRVIKTSKLAMEGFSQIAFVNFQHRLYLLSFGKDVPNSTVSLLLEVAENDEDNFVFYANVNDFKRIFGTLGDTITLTFRENDLQVYSENDGITTNLTVIREQALTSDVDITYRNAVEDLTVKLRNVHESKTTISRELFVKKLDNMVKLKSLDKSDAVGNIVFGNDNLSMQQFSYAAVEPLKLGFQARIPMDVVILLQGLLKSSTDEEITTYYDKATMTYWYQSSDTYMQVSHIPDTSQDLERFVPNDGNEVTVNKNKFLNSGKVIKQYLGDVDVLYISIEGNTLTLTNTMNRERIEKSTTPKVILPIERGTTVTDNIYGVSANGVLGLIGILEGDEVKLYFEADDNQQLLYVESEETRHFMYMDIYS